MKSIPAACAAVLIVYVPVIILLITDGLGSAANGAQIVSLFATPPIVAAGILAVFHKPPKPTMPESSSRSRVSNSPEDSSKDLRSTPKKTRTSSRPSITINFKFAGGSLIGAAIGVAITLLATIVISLMRGPETRPPNLITNLAIIVGAHQNAPKQSLDQASVEEIRNSIAYQTLNYASVITSDGAPRVAFSSLFIEKNPPANKAEAEKKADIGIARIRSTIDAITPSAPGDNLLKALELTSQIPTYGSTLTIMVLDSGLQTYEPLTFQSGLLEQDASAVTTCSLDKSHLIELSRLQGSRVVFIGLGDVVEPQSPLSSTAKSNLAKIWTNIAMASQANNVEQRHFSEPREQNTMQMVPTVPTVPPSPSPSKLTNGVKTETRCGNP